MGEGAADVSDGDVAENGPDHAAGIEPAPSGPASTVPADVEALIREAVERIAASLPPVPAVQPNPVPEAVAVEPPFASTSTSDDVKLPDGSAGSDQPGRDSVAVEDLSAVLSKAGEAGVVQVAAEEDRAPSSDVQPAAPAVDDTRAAALLADSEEVRGSSSPWIESFKGPWTWRRVARLASLAVAAYFATVLFLILAYRFINPPTTTLIAYQWLTGTKIEQDWVAIEDISPNLLRAVVVSEDWGFCDHFGVDLDAIEKALEQAGEGKLARGASTISMQVTKNLFLSQSKSYLRKAVEIPLTFVAEIIWPKSRMLEIYLNIAEWGPGVFGAEAAARHHFNKPAARLTERESALLAAALPNPIVRDAGDPGTRTARKASIIQARMRAAGASVADCAMAGRQRRAQLRSGGGAGEQTGWQTTVKKRAGAAEGL